MMPSEDQAQQLFLEAEKKLTPRGFFQALFTSSKNRREDAIECYQKAGNLFKLAKNWFQASKAFRLAADLNLQETNRSEAAHDYVQAAKCLEKYDVNAAVNFFLNAIQIYTDMGRFTMAAKLHNNIADIYEQNLELDKAVQHYEQAADYFRVEENYVSAKKCILKVADYVSAEFEDYTRAINIFQEIAFYDLKTPILRYNVKDNLFKAVLCHMSIDPLNAKLALDSYVEKCPDFEVSRQYALLRMLIDCIEESDENAFSQVIADYDMMSRLDNWHTKILLKIKKQIKDTPDLL